MEGSNSAAEEQAAAAATEVMTTVIPRQQIARVSRAVEQLSPGFVRHELGKTLRRLRQVLDREEARALSSGGNSSTSIGAALAGLAEGAVSTDAQRLFVLVHKSLVSRGFRLRVRGGGGGSGGGGGGGGGGAGARAQHGGSSGGESSIAEVLPVGWRAGEDVFSATYARVDAFPAVDAVRIRAMVVGEHLCLSVSWAVRIGTAAAPTAAAGGGGCEGDCEREAAVELSIRDFVNDGVVYSDAEEHLADTLQRRVVGAIAKSVGPPSAATPASAADDADRKRGRREPGGGGSRGGGSGGGDDGGWGGAGDGPGLGGPGGGDGGAGGLFGTPFPGILVGPDHPMFRDTRGSQGARGGPRGPRGMRPRYDPIGPGNPEPFPGHSGHGEHGGEPGSNFGNDEFLPPPLEDEHQLLGSAGERGGGRGRSAGGRGGRAPGMGRGSGGLGPAAPR